MTCNFSIDIYGNTIYYRSISHIKWKEDIISKLIELLNSPSVPHIVSRIVDKEIIELKLLLAKDMIYPERPEEKEENPKDPSNDVPIWRK